MRIGVRIDNKGRVGIRFFENIAAANEYLRSEGFYETYGVYRHLNQSVAGIFLTDSYNNQDIMRKADNCIKPLKGTNSYMKLLGQV